MKVEELLSGYQAPKYFILDSHQDAMSEQEVGHRYEDSDYIGYGYNIHQFNQLVEGSFFLYRRPGKLSVDKKFHIYGGGIVEAISKPDINGNVFASIKLGFELDNSINQGDYFIETYSWKTRAKPGPGWKGFWLNYGMNEIAAVDFWNLIKDRTCKLCGNEISQVHTVEENETVNYESLGENFEISVSKASFYQNNHPASKMLLPKKIDFNALNKRKKTIGTVGELLVLEYENTRLEQIGSEKRAEHVAETVGDGLGYDIKSYDENGCEVHIEVKTTKSNLCDNFFMSRRELEESKNTSFRYMVYRIYNYNEREKTASLIIYEGAVTEDGFELEPVSYRVKSK